MNIQDSHLILRIPFKVTSADTDMSARLKPGSLLNMLIQSAIQSADSLGFGFGGLKKQQLFWVLSRMHIDIVRPLKWYENIIVETWPKNVDGLLYIRDFFLYDEKGEMVGKATSGWLAIDMVSKRPKLYEGIDASMLNTLKYRHAIEELPEKLEGTSEGDENEIPVTYYDIDLNRHVTSCRYLDWMVDQIPVDYLLSHYPLSISLNYIKETQLGERISMRTIQQDPKTFIFEGTHIKAKKTSCKGRIIFQ